MASIVTQERKLPNPQPGCRNTLMARGAQPGGNTVTSIPWADFASITQETTSFRTGLNEPTGLEYSAYDLFRDQRLKYKAPYDTGHEFSTEKRFTRVSHPDAEIYGGRGSRYRGPLRVAPNLGTFIVPPSWDWVRDGSKAIANTIPTNSRASLGETLGELKKIPRIPFSGMAAAELKDNAKFLRGVGSEYLNSTFGWLPLLGSVLDACRSIVYSTDYLKQLQRDSGKLVRRSFHFQPRTSYVVKTNPGPHQLGFVNYSAGSGVHNYKFWLYANDAGSVVGRNYLNSDCEESIREDVYFKGAYTYYLEDGSSAIQNLERISQQAKYVLDLRVLTPETLWNLAPWSWLVDWNLNVGDFIHNAQMFSEDKLVLKYGYVMRKTTTSRTYTAYGQRFSRWDVGPISNSYMVIRKERKKATPYGFGLNPDGFSASQWAILGALGMTQGSNVLRIR